MSSETKEDFLKRREDNVSLSPEMIDVLGEEVDKATVDAVVDALREVGASITDEDMKEVIKILADSGVYISPEKDRYIDIKEASGK